MCTALLEVFELKHSSKLRLELGSPLLDAGKGLVVLVILVEGQPAELGPAVDQGLHKSIQ